LIWPQRSTLTSCLFSFSTDTATTAIYTLSLHDALPICSLGMEGQGILDELAGVSGGKAFYPRTNAEMDDIFEQIADKRPCHPIRSEEHTSELQSRENLVCRLLLEKKKKN